MTGGEPKREGMKTPGLPASGGKPMRGWARLVPVLACALLGAIITADVRPGQEEEEKSPLPGTYRYAREVGPRLLSAEKWQEAGELFGGWYSLVNASVEDVWDAHADWSQAERNQYRYHLLNFYVWHMNFEVDWWAPTALLAEVADKYEGWAAEMPVTERGDEVDLSPTDLLGWVQDWDMEREIAEVERERVKAVLKERPESVPGIIAYVMCLWETEYGPERQGFLGEGVKLLTGRLGRLSLARVVTSMSFEEGEDLQAGILERGWRLAPSREERSFLLCRLMGLQPREKAIASAREAYESFPETRAARHARAQAASLLMEERGPEGALAEVRRLQEMGDAQKDGLDDALVRIAGKFMEGEGEETGEALFREVVRDYPGTLPSAEAMSRLAEICAERGDASGEIEWLEKSIEIAPGREDRVEKLAGIYEEGGKWEDALRVWEGWESGTTGCGNCNAQQHLRRAYHVGRLQRRAGRFTDLVKLGAETLRSAWYDSAGCSCRTAMELYSLYRDAGQVGDLDPIIRALEDARMGRRVDPAEVGEEARKERFGGTSLGLLRDLVQIDEMGVKGEVAGLMRIVQGGEMEGGGSRCQRGTENLSTAAAEALADCGEKGVEAIREVYREEGDIDDFHILTLARCDSPEALALLEEVSTAGLIANAAEKLCAIASKGKAGREVLERIAARDDLRIQEAAIECLAELDAGRLPDGPLPRPEPGSLPRELPLR